MDKFELQKLRELPIEGVAERLGLEVTRHRALCPFHDDHHPSLGFSVRHNSYRCYSCGARGGVIDLAMGVLNKGFVETCEWLANSSNILLLVPRPAHSEETERGHFQAGRYERFFDRPWLSTEACRFLFEERRLDPRVVRWCRLNSYQDKQGTPWLQIPYFDQQGQLVGVQCRNLAPSNGGDQEGGPPRFRFPYGAQCHVYNLPVLNRLRAGDDLWIAEGCSDCWAHLSAGHKCIAIPSATLLKPEDFGPISELGLRLGLRFLIYPDHDEAGESLYRQLQELTSALGLRLTRHDLPAGCKDFSDYYAKGCQ